MFSNFFWNDSKISLSKLQVECKEKKEDQNSTNNQKLHQKMLHPLTMKNMTYDENNIEIQKLVSPTARRRKIFEQFPVYKPTVQFSIVQNVPLNTGSSVKIYQPKDHSTVIVHEIQKQISEEQRNMTKKKTKVCKENGFTFKKQNYRGGFNPESQRNIRVELSDELKNVEEVEQISSFEEEARKSQFNMAYQTQKKRVDELEKYNKVLSEQIEKDSVLSKSNSEQSSSMSFRPIENSPSNELLGESFFLKNTNNKMVNPRDSLSYSNSKVFFQNFPKKSIETSQMNSPLDLAETLKC